MTIKQQYQHCPVTIGTIVTSNCDKHLIAQVLPGECCAISLLTGNRQRDPIKVESVGDITHAELQEMLGGAYDKDAELTIPDWAQPQI